MHSMKDSKTKYSSHFPSNFSSEIITFMELWNSNDGEIEADFTDIP